MRAVILLVLFSHAVAALPFNVLMIAVDDLRPPGHSFDEPEIQVPNMDRLASESVIFTRAYVQAASCGPSRSSLLTGRRPDTTYVTGNSACPFTTSPSHNKWQSLPQYFREQGYITAGHGKIFHPNVCEGAAVGEQSAAWSLPYYHAPCISLGSMYAGGCFEDYPGPVPCLKPCKKVISDYANATAEDDDMPDGMIAKQAITTLRKLAKANMEKPAQPFFVGVGFHKPHLPHIAPKKYFDLYPLENVSLPVNPLAPKDAPDFAWNHCGEWQSYPDVKKSCQASNFSREQPIGDDEARKQRRAYFAAASYSDAQIGRVLQELSNLGLANSTVVTLWGDHGWHLGENNEWGKHTAMTRSLRAPLLFKSPGAAPAKRRDLAEFVDIFPTLADLAGIKVPPRCANVNMSQTHPSCTEGESLGPVIRGQSHVAKVAAFGQWPLAAKKGTYMGYSMFTSLSDGSEVRYTEWVTYDAKHTSPHPDWSTIHGRELYNHTSDSHESENVAERADLKGIVSDLSKQLHAGWRLSDEQIPGHTRETTVV